MRDPCQGWEMLEFLLHHFGLWSEDSIVFGLSFLNPASSGGGGGGGRGEGMGVGWGGVVGVVGSGIPTAGLGLGASSGTAGECTAPFLTLGWPCLGSPAPRPGL